MTKKGQSSAATNQLNLLREIDAATLAESEPVLFVFIGKPGSGKSSFVAQIPNSIFLYHKNDHGIIELKRRKLVPKSTFIWANPFINLKTLYDQMELVRAAAPAAGKTTVIIEGLTGIGAIWAKHAIDTVYQGNAAAYHDFGKGVKVLATRDNYLPKFMKLVTDLRESGINVVLTGHAREKSDTDTKSGTVLNKSGTEFPPLLLNTISGYASFHGVFCKRTTPDKVSGKSIVKAGKDGVSTYLTTDEDAYGDAKNRYGLDEPILMDGTPEERYRTFCNTLKIDSKTLRDFR